MIVSGSRYGYGFIPEQFLPEGTDEYYLRNIQAKSADRRWRHLRSGEIELLVKNANSCDDWDDILVQDPFDPTRISRNSFHGLVRIGAVQDGLLKYHDFTVPEGITGCRIISTDIGDHCAIHDCAYISHYIIGDRVILHRIDEMQTTDHAKFGVGVVKEGEDPSVRVTIHVMNEAGGRAVAPFDGMICADAWLWAAYRDDELLMRRFQEMTDRSCDLRRGWYGKVGDGSVLKSCGIIKDVMFGPASYAKGAHKLKNLTIRSTEQSPTQLGEGIELVNGIIGSGCHIFYGCKAVRFIMGDNSNLKYGARLLNSILGDNSTVSCCEVLNNLVFPGHEQHHNNSFLIASLVMGQSNMAAGATVGSNHNSRGNDGEIVAGRGFWPALSSTLKHDSKFASFTLLVKGNYPAELNIPLPFCLLSDNTCDHRRELMPAYWWMYNMYALERNSWKYTARDRRKRIVQHVETDYLAPDTAQEMLQALDLLQRWTAQAWCRIHGVDPDAMEPSELSRKGFELLSEHPDEVSTMEVVGENLENTIYPVKILKPAEGWRSYRDMLLYYGVKSVGRWCVDSGMTLSQFQREHATTKPSSPWLNLGGQLVLERKVQQLRQDIRSGRISTWREVHDQYELWWKEYPCDRACDGLQVLRSLLVVDSIDPPTWASLTQEVRRIRAYVEDQVLRTKQKDYDNAFREITYRSLAERNAVLGRVEDNPFIAEAKRQSEDLFAVLDAVQLG